MFLIFNAAIAHGQLALLMIAMANVVVSLYYYLMVVRAAYLLEPAVEQPPLPVPAGMKLLTGILVAAMVICSVYPTLILELSDSAAAVLAK